MKIKNSLYGIIISVILSVFFISGCGKDNPVIPPPPPPQDTADVYDWSYLEMDNMLDLFVYDTNNIYTMHGIGVYCWDGKGNGKLINLMDPNFYDNYADNYESNIYIAGVKRIAGDLLIPCVKKVVNNNVVASFELPYYDTSSVWRILTVGYDKFWLTQWRHNSVYYFDNGNFKKYELDSGMMFSYMHQDKYGNTYLFSHLVIINPPNPKYSFRYSYKFENDNFNLLCKDSVALENYYRIYECGDEILSVDDFFDINYFNGISWIPFLQTPGVNNIELGGLGLNYIVSFVNDANWMNVYIWNGTTFRKEKYLETLLLNNQIGMRTDVPAQIFLSDDIVYIPVPDEYVLIGRPKNNPQKFKFDR